MTTPIIITIPKYVTTTTTMNSSSSSSPMFKDYVDIKSHPDHSVKGRKRRLDHLSWEEKLQRKKLKNRVAAQTSRDRKKQKMDEMEATVEELMEKNEKLMRKCEKLENLNAKLSTENGELRRQLLSLSSECDRSKSKCQCEDRSAVDCNLSNGPAVSTHTIPLPQGEGIQSAGVLYRRRQTTVTILKILMTCLLCQTSSPISTQNSTLTSLKSLLKVYSKISPQTWKQLLQRDRLRQVIAKKIAQEKWWGRHQSMWNPVGTLAT